MPETLICPHCRGAVTVPDELLGGGVTCPHCKGVFGAAMPVPDAPPPTPAKAKKPADPFAFSSATPDEESDEPESYRRHKQENWIKFTPMVGLIIALIVVITMVLGIAYGQLPRPVGGGIDMPRALIMGLIGGAASGGIALARMVGLQAAKDARKSYQKRRR